MSNPASACGTYTWGETEDYTVNLQLPSSVSASFIAPSTAWIKTVVKFLNSFIKIHNIKHNPEKMRRKLNKYSICVVRVSECDDGTVKCMNSMPCRDCFQKLQNVGLHKVCYTAEDSQIYTCRIKDIDTTLINYTGVMRKEGVLNKTRTYNLLA